MYPTQLHSYLLWRSSVDPDPQALASRRYTATVALIPAIMVGLFVFGWYAGLVVLLSTFSAFCTDYICHRVVRQESYGTRDGTWLLTGLLLGLLLPPNAPLWLPVLGGIVAVAIGKYLMSVDGMPFLQPAAIGLLVLFVAFFPWMQCLGPQGKPQWPVLNHSVEASSQAVKSLDAWKLVQDFFGGDVRQSVTREQYREAAFLGKPALLPNDKAAQAVHGPRPLDLVKEHPAHDVSKAVAATRGEAPVQPVGWLDMVLGDVPAAIGASSALALILGILLLVFSGACSWLLPFCALATLFVGLELLAWLYGGHPGAKVIYANIPIHLLSGSTLLGIFYLAADPATAPRSWLGKVYAGVALGVIELLLRTFTPLTEGIFISVILVQGLSFVFDQWLAPPREAPRSSSSNRLTSTSLSRL